MREILTSAASAPALAAPDPPAPEEVTPEEVTPDDLGPRLAARLAALRAAHGWSLDALAERTGISRATLSRLERGETSPTAAMLGRLSAAHGWTVSRLLASAEGEQGASPLLRRDEQSFWIDPETGFRGRTVSPPMAWLRAELVEGELPAGAEVAYPGPAVPGMEQHVWLLAGALTFAHGAFEWRLAPGDCLRLRLDGPTRLAAGRGGARYLLVVALP